MQGFGPLFRMLGDRIEALLGDKGYDADAIRAELAAAGVQAVIPAKSNRRVPIPHDRAKYRWRNLLTQTVSAATEEQSASMEEIASSSQALSCMAEELRETVAKFKI